MEIHSVLQVFFWSSQKLAGKHSDRLLDVVLLARTNDLSDRRITPEKLTDKLDALLTELKQFSNVNQNLIFKVLTIK